MLNSMSETEKALKTRKQNKNANKIWIA